jgi:hypothetical protein
MSFDILLEQYGAWGIIAFLSFMLLKYVLHDLRIDQASQTKELLREHDKSFSLVSRVHERLDKQGQQIQKVLSIIERMNGK